MPEIEKIERFADRRNQVRYAITVDGQTYNRFFRTGPGGEGEPSEEELARQVTRIADSVRRYREVTADPRVASAHIGGDGKITIHIQGRQNPIKVRWASEIGDALKRPETLPRRPDISAVLKKARNAD